VALLDFLGPDRAHSRWQAQTRALVARSSSDHDELVGMYRNVLTQRADLSDLMLAISELPAKQISHLTEIDLRDLQHAELTERLADAHKRLVEVAGMVEDRLFALAHSGRAMDDADRLETLEWLRTLRETEVDPELARRAFRSVDAS